MAKSCHGVYYQVHRSADAPFISRFVKEAYIKIKDDAWIQGNWDSMMLLAWLYDWLSTEICFYQIKSRCRPCVTRACRLFIYFIGEELE
jgi:hypothetical protein